MEVERATELEKKLDLVFESCPLEVFDKTKIDIILEMACKLIGATVVATTYHEFPFPDKTHPEGLTVIKILSESDLVCHTYPLEEEKRSITISISTCGQHTNPERAIFFLIKELRPQKLWRSFPQWDELKV